MDKKERNRDMVKETERQGDKKPWKQRQRERKGRDIERH